MLLSKFLRKYEHLEDFKTWSEKFPDMYLFASEVEVIPWQEEYQVADRNAEILDELDFWYELYKNKMITKEEYEKRRKEILDKAKGILSKTRGIAFIESRAVSFRDNFPPLWVVLHELGHVYFKEPDPTWSAVYGGGEKLMWLIIKGFAEGNERTLKRWMELLRKTYENPKEAEEILNRTAKNLLSRLNVKITDEEMQRYLKHFPEEERKKEIYKYCIFSGYLPENPKTVGKSSSVNAILMNAIEGIKWKDPFWQEFFEELNENYLKGE